MPKITFEKIIHAKLEKVFEIVTNYEEFQKTLPQYFPSIRVRSVRDNVSIVEEHLNLGGKELVMMTKHVKHPPTLHEVFVIGGDGKGSIITEKYESVDNGTKITISADLKLKGAMRIVGFFGKQKIQDSYSKIIDEFAKIAEN